MNQNILVITVLVVSIACFQACKDSGSSRKISSDTVTSYDTMTNWFGEDTTLEHNQMVKKLMEEINAMTMTGDFDLDFATMMMTHNYNAVDMAETYLPKAIVEKVKSIAQNIINSQKMEIEELKNFIANHNIGKKKEEHADKGHGDEEHNKIMEAMNTMIDKLKGLQMSGDSDKDFLTMMLAHHESAVMMAQSEISLGNHSDAKKMAQKIMANQKKEIKQIKEWLAKAK